MKVITTGLLNRFWTKGIKPWLDKRIKSYADLMVTTASGYTTDALAVKEGFTEVNSKLEWEKLFEGSGYSTETPINLLKRLSSYSEILMRVKYDNNTFATSAIPIQDFINAKLSATGYAAFNDSLKNGGYIRYETDSSIVVWTSTNDILITCYAR